MMRFFRDDLSLLVPVIWYVVPDTAPALPYGTPFCSRDWEFAEAGGDPGLLLGEVYGERSYHAGVPPVELAGVGLCGSREQWERGCSVLDLVRPLNPTTGQQCCCGPGVLPGQSNLALSLAADVTQPPVSGCPYAPDSPATWVVQMAGVTAGACTGCSAFNADWPLPYLAGSLDGCTWSGPGADLVCGGTPYTTTWNLAISVAFDPVNVNLSLKTFPPSATVAAYIRPIADWDMNGPNVMTRIIGGAQCGFPLTVTVAPGG